MFDFGFLFGLVFFKKTHQQQNKQNQHLKTKQHKTNKDTHTITVFFFVVGNITFKHLLARRPASNMLFANLDTQSTQIYVYALQPKSINLKKI